MIIYICVFIISFFLFKLNKRFCTIIGILLPSVLAGVRDYTIGTDILVYGNAWFSRALNTHNLFEYIAYAAPRDIGAAYALLNWVVAHIVGNAHFFYFVLNLLCNVLAYLGLKKNEDCLDVSFGMFAYYCLFYCRTYNILRQSIAVLIIFWGFWFIRQKKLGAYLLTVFVAMLFHSSAIIGVVIYILYWVSNSKLKSFVKFLIVVACIACIGLYRQIIELLIKINVLSNRYEMYINDTGGGGGFIRIFLLCVPLMLVLTLLIKKQYCETKEYNALGTYTVVSFFISLLTFRLASIARIAYYFDIYFVYAWAVISGKLQYIFKIRQRNCNELLIGCYLLFYWIYVFGLRNSGEVVPYLFMRY